MDNVTTRHELLLRQLHNNKALTLIDCANDPCITALVLRYCHHSQAKSGAQVMGVLNLQQEHISPMVNPQVEDDKACALQGDHLHTDSHVPCKVLKVDGDHQERLDAAQSGNTSSGWPCEPMKS